MGWVILIIDCHSTFPGIHGQSGWALDPGNVGMAGDNQNDRVVIFDDKNITAAAELRFCNLQ